ncbi:MAG: diphthine--ammonia ligase [Methanophagales archaeon]|nr:diphthine--ammonia ligase [Methanophagales archaeon]
MCEIIGVFNNEKSTELVIKGLDVLKKGRETDFRISTEKGDWHSKDLQELKQVVKGERSRNCIACCSCNASLLRKGSKDKLVADAEIYNRGELDEKAFLSDKRVDAAYAFAHWIREGNSDELCIARDIIGLKPVCFAHADGFAFASEKKGLEAMGFPHAWVLDPRVLLRYDVREDRLRFVKRDFFDPEPELKEDKEKQKGDLLHLLRASISRRIPSQSGDKFGVLFSGGLDSTLIAYLCKDLGADFVCYTVAVEEPGMKEAEDLRFAERFAADLGVEWKQKKMRVKELEKYVKEVVPVIEDTDVMMTSVALPLYVACEFAKEDCGIKTVLYGLGAEELFAGYERHRRVKKEELNKECLAGLLRTHERDLYRDELVAKAQGISLRAPFLAPDIVDYALRIPASYKLSLDKTENKLILRDIARDLGLAEVASRKKRAVQYGSNFLKAIEKLAKKNGFRYKRDYLRTFYASRSVKLGCLFSSGKDSAYALWLMLKEGYPVECLITLKSHNPESYMFHTPAVELVELQAEAIGLPLIMEETQGEKEKELEDLRAALRESKMKYGIEGVITGALRSNYQKERIERVAAEETLKAFSPLWHVNQETEMRLVVNTFELIFTGISAYGLDKSWLGRRITEEDVDRLVALDKKIAKHFDQTFPKFVGMNIAGEGGEFESLVLDGPAQMFKKRVVIEESEIVEEDANTARLVVKEARLVGK